MLEAMLSSVPARLKNFGEICDVTYEKKLLSVLHDHTGLDLLTVV